MQENKPRTRSRKAETIRQRSERVEQEQANAGKPRRLRATTKKVATPFRIIARPLRWLGRHLIPRYFRSSFSELRLVVWPNRKQTRQLTMAVLLFAIVLGFVVTVLDYGLDKLFKKVILKQ